MASLLAGLGSSSFGAGLSSALGGGGLSFGSLGSGLGSLLGSALAPDLKGTGISEGLNSLMNPQSQATSIPTTAATPNTQPGQVPAAQSNPLSVMYGANPTPQQGSQMGFSSLLSQLLGH